MNVTNNKPPVWFWVLSVIALLWNTLGVMAYLTKAFATDEMISALPAEQQAEFLTEFPAWYTAAFALAVFCGALGCISLLVRKKWAYLLFIISALGAIVQHGYLFSTVEMMTSQIIMPIMVIIVCILLVVFSKSARGKNWIN